MDAQAVASSNSAPLLLLSAGRPRSVSPVSPTHELTDLRGARLFRAIGRRLGRYRQRRQQHQTAAQQKKARLEGETDEDSSSSTDSDSRSSSSGACSGSGSGSSGKGDSAAGSSSGASGSGSDDSGVGLSPRTTGPPNAGDACGRSGAHAFRKVFQSLSINARSHSASCASSSSSPATPTGHAGRSSRLSVAAAAAAALSSSSSGGRNGSGGSNKKSPKRILRSPVAYTYVRGLSGLPTQRVPRDYPCVLLPQPPCCSGKYPTAPRHFAGHGLNR
ncbi:putative lysozyme-like protein [Schistocerca serialis cubense]|uniref:putative lysozyme-like protein n=1 Tax=Schistocerca serialis cubense TaxID=2023355 RepID=UPI00214E88BF|nr:putative lysozyme-like protein [Schistocerca serialis cubense]